MKMTPTETLHQYAKAFHLEEISNIVLKDERFPLWSAASKPHQHHYGKGGLAQHTLEVVEICQKMNDYFRPMGKGCQAEPLFLAALFHDAGKMWDYLPKLLTLESLSEFRSKQTSTWTDYANWESAQHKRLIHHISRSGILWSQAVAKTLSIHPNLHNIEEDVLHAILAHHGQRAYGSPVTPCTPLAWLLHLGDSASARMDDWMKNDLVKAKE